MRANSAVRWGLVVALFGLVLRLGLLIFYEPIAFGDTPSYQRLATALLESGLSGYDATRVPGYPIFLALLGQDPAKIWPVQLAIGWGISMLLFLFGWKTTSAPAFGALLGLLYNLIPGQALFESNLLSETLTAFFVTLSLALMVILDRAQSRWAQIAAGVGMGTSAALAGLVRPLFFILPVWLLIFVWFGPKGRDLTIAISFSAAPLLLLGGWLGWVYTTYDMLAPTTMGGYHLVQHTGEYFEYLPDEAAELRDTYLKYRDAQIAKRGSPTNAIWDAIPEMSAVSGLNFFDLSAELQRLSVQLIRQHPGRYLMNAAEGWVDFWKAPVYWHRASLRSELLGNALAIWVVAGRVVSIVANAIFLFGSVAVALSKRIRMNQGADRYVLAAGGLVWIASIVQTLVDHGDNPRFLIPLQILVFYVVLRWIWQWRAAQSVERN